MTAAQRATMAALRVEVRRQRRYLLALADAVLPTSRRGLLERIRGTAERRITAPKRARR